jgi:hypothetical protein
MRPRPASHRIAQGFQNAFIRCDADYKNILLQMFQHFLGGITDKQRVYSRTGIIIATDQLRPATTAFGFSPRRVSRL